MPNSPITKDRVVIKVNIFMTNIDSGLNFNPIIKIVINEILEICKK